MEPRDQACSDSEVYAMRHNIAFHDTALHNVQMGYKGFSQNPRHQRVLFQVVKLTQNIPIKLQEQEVLN